MKNRFINELVSPSKRRTEPGPVITISRDYGCPAKRIAGMLSSALNRKELENNSKYHWQWIGKEILDESAKELNLNPNVLKQVAKKEQSSVVNEIVMSLSHKYYPGDQKIKKTIGEVIRTFAEQGHVIIVGRGGVSITRDIPDSLHIKLQAPLEWRINDVCKREDITLAEARRKIVDLDKQREMIRAFFEGKKVSDTAYDVIFNYMTLGEEDIISTILQLMESKNLI